MSEELKLQRTRAQWSGCDPKLMAQQSPAAIMYALQDAKRDIDALHRHADKISAELAALKAGQGEAVAWVVEDDDGSQPRLARLKHPLPPVGTKLYTAPPATGVIVDPDLLRRVLSFMDSTNKNYPMPYEMREELRSLLAQANEVKS